MAQATHTPTDFTVESAAAELGVHPRTIRRWIERGQLRAYRVGPRLLRIDAEALDAVKSSATGGER